MVQPSTIIRGEKPASAGAPLHAMPSYNDLILSVARTKDEQAFLALFSHFAPRVKSFLMRSQLSEQEAEELAQETMLMVWQKADRFDPKVASAATWIYTIARNKKIDRLRKNHVVTLDIDDLAATEHEPSSAASVENDWMQGRMRERLRSAIDELPVDQANIVHKAFFEDMSHSEISAATDIPLGTVKSRLRLGMAHLRESLNDASFSQHELHKEKK
jgi:RNA polymerase sigma factor (sigma-70 family)